MLAVNVRAHVKKMAYLLAEFLRPPFSLHAATRRQPLRRRRQPVRQLQPPPRQAAQPQLPRHGTACRTTARHVLTDQVLAAFSRKPVR